MTEEEKALRYLATPSGFASGVLGFKLHGWQKRVMDEFDDLHGRTKVVCSTPNGVSKSSRINATLILRTLCTKPQARVVATSGD